MGSRTHAVRYQTVGPFFREDSSCAAGIKLHSPSWYLHWLAHRRHRRAGSTSWAGIWGWGGVTVFTLMRVVRILATGPSLGSAAPSMAVITRSRSRHTWSLRRPRSQRKHFPLRRGLAPPRPIAARSSVFRGQIIKKSSNTEARGLFRRNAPLFLPLHHP